MFGKTNSVIAASSGGGEEIVAVNSTGGALSGGDKVWLNRHIFPTDSSGELVDTGRVSQVYMYNLKNKFYCRNYAEVARADYQNGEWKFPVIASCAAENLRAVQIQNGLVWGCDLYTKSYILKEMGNSVTVNGLVISENLAIVSKKVCAFNPSSGEVTTEGGVISYAYGDPSSAFKFGDILFVGVSNKYFSFYDISDITAPVELFSNSLSASELFVYATGCQPGDYLISRATDNTNERSLAILHIYKIKEDYSLELATDLPQGLNALIGQFTCVSFNNDTGILCVGTLSDLFVFKFSNGKFVEMNVNLPELPQTDEYSPYLARFSDDMSTLAVAYVLLEYGRSYRNIAFYRLSMFDDKWYAENFIEVQSSSLCGFALADAAEGEEVAVKTAMPEVCVLTVNVNNDDAVISVKGAV